MKINTIEQVKSLNIGDYIYIPHSFSLVDEYIFVGLFEDFYFFIDKVNSKILKIYKDRKEDFKFEYRLKYIFTTYEEAIDCMKELCINTINHYNNHQLKNNPIKVIENK